MLTHSQTPLFGDIEIHSEFTARSLDGLSPWNDASYSKGLSQINLGYNPISLLEVVSLLNIRNIARNLFHHNLNNCLEKYNPKIYLGTFYVLAEIWNYDTETKPLYPQNWPESLFTNVVIY